MAFSLPLSQQLTQARWKVKIFDKEGREDPHVTIIRGVEKWRINLRTGKFIDDDPPARKVDKKVLETVVENWDLLCKEWNKIHAHNPVEVDDHEDS